jgi:hypothetical protein
MSLSPLFPLCAVSSREGHMRTVHASSSPLSALPSGQGPVFEIDTNEIDIWSSPTIIFCHYDDTESERLPLAEANITTSIQITWAEKMISSFYAYLSVKNSLDLRPKPD